MVKIINGNLLESKDNIICHQCNCQGVMGNGVAYQIRKHHPEVFKEYIKFCNGKIPSELLGQVLYVQITQNANQKVANLFAQNLFGDVRTTPHLYTNYEALKKCLLDLQHTPKHYSIAFPYLMSCGLGGGDWTTVEGMILDILGDREVNIYRYKEQIL